MACNSGGSQGTILLVFQYINFCTSIWHLMANGRELDLTSKLVERGTESTESSVVLLLGGAYLCGECKVAGKCTEPTLHQIGENGLRMVETKRLLKTRSSAIHEHSGSMRAVLLSNNFCPKRLSLPLLMTQAGLDLLLHISSKYFASYHSYVL
jgi:hypothetical protein